MFELVETNDSVDVRLLRMFNQFFRRVNEDEKALSILTEAYEKDPDNREMMMELLRGYYFAKKNQEMQILLTDWIQRYPDDEEVRRYLRPQGQPQDTPSTI